MAQRKSGHKRLPRDNYATPAWCTEAVLPHLGLRRGSHVLEPAAGAGKMARVLRKHGFKVFTDDITRGHDFLNRVTPFRGDAIITNPPYKFARQFIENALELTENTKGLVAMLLSVDFDSAATRVHLFAEHPAFTKKIVLTKRIRWIEDSTGSPSENHAWYVWDWSNEDEPTIGYAP